MGKQKEAVANPYLQTMFQLGLYKRSQGRIARQATFVAIVAASLLAAYQISSLQLLDGPAGTLLAPAALVVLCCWIAYRLVNVPSFADFLIGVEAEMNKVSWPSKLEMYRSVIVVIFSITFLAALLFVYDLVLTAALGGFWRIVDYVF